jgi:hypothetical protein
VKESSVIVQLALLANRSRHTGSPRAVRGSPATVVGETVSVGLGVTVGVCVGGIGVGDSVGGGGAVSVIAKGGAVGACGEKAASVPATRVATMSADGVCGNALQAANNPASKSSRLRFTTGLLTTDS